MQSDRNEDDSRSSKDVDDHKLFEPWEIKTHRRRRKRRPTLASISKQALKAGANKVTLAPDGTVSLEFSNPGVEPTPTNPWDEVLEHELPH